MFGDKNSSFFHAATVTRRRRNEIGQIFIPGLGWVSDGGFVRRAFVNHVKKIYSKGIRLSPSEVYNPQFLQGLPKIQLLGLSPYRSAGPDDFIAFILQQNWLFLGPLFSAYFGAHINPSFVIGPVYSGQKRLKIHCYYY